MMKRVLDMTGAALGLAGFFILAAGTAHAESNWTSKDRDEIYRVIGQQAEEGRRGPPVIEERYYDLGRVEESRRPAPHRRGPARRRPDAR